MYTYINKYIYIYNIYIYLSVCVWVYRGLHCDFGTSPIFSKKYGAVPCCTSSKLKALLPSLRCSPSTLQHQDLSINNQIGDQHLWYINDTFMIYQHFILNQISSFLQKSGVVKKRPILPHFRRHGRCHGQPHRHAEDCRGACSSNATGCGPEISTRPRSNISNVMSNIETLWTVPGLVN